MKKLHTFFLKISCALSLAHKQHVNMCNVLQFVMSETMYNHNLQVNKEVYI